MMIFYVEYSFRMSDIFFPSKYIDWFVLNIYEKPVVDVFDA